MESFDTSANRPVRTVLHLSPSVAVAAIVSAQNNKSNLREWLDRIVIEACCSPLQEPEANAGMRLTDQRVLELFAKVAAEAPNLLEGRWRVLLAHASQDETLWNYPKLTVGEAEEGLGLGICEPTVNLEALRRQWPKLLAAAFVS